MKHLRSLPKRNPTGLQSHGCLPAIPKNSAAAREPGFMPMSEMTILRHNWVIRRAV